MPERTSLPIENIIGSVREAMGPGRRAVVTAPPGSGKTTIIPLALADRIDGKIVMLEPRRLATRAAARRMAFLLDEEVGQTVGYVTRDDRRPGRRIEVVTEGVLTRRLQNDPSLFGTGLVIFDEFHERNLQTDLGMALTLDSMAALRPDLALLVMSATIDPERVAALVDGPVITGKGLMHPVEVRWFPPARNTRLEAHVAAAIRTALSDEGDILVFLPGMAEMEKVQRLIEGVECHLLHGSLPVSQQDAALLPGRDRKVILSTDIAETSLTVEGVRIVIDSGLARAPRFDPHTGMTRLRTVPISRASAEQRAGRAGRVEPGVAIRLWSKLEHGARIPFTPPEITEVDLAGLALELAVWGSDDLRFLDPPPERGLREGRELLVALGAIDLEGRPTAAGRAMSDLPLHPRMAHMLTAAADRSLAAALAALLEERDPFTGIERPADLALRIEALNGKKHERADPRGLDRVRRSAQDLIRRVKGGWEVPDPARAGETLALAYPDRLAIRRGSPGRFQLRTGTTAFVANDDPLATEQFLIAADLDGKRKDARIRLAAAIDPEAVAALFADEVDLKTRLVWDDDRLVERTERRLGGFSLDTVDRPPSPGPETTKVLIARVRKFGWRMLDPEGKADALRDRVRFLRGSDPERWPDWSEKGLLASLDKWLGPRLGVSLEVDVVSILRRSVDTKELDRLAPSHLRLANGKRVSVSYQEGVPRISVRVADMYGIDQLPPLAGFPVVIEMLSPANRPVQVTSDLPGFWRGSWAAVRKEMLARYPKHPWPLEPWKKSRF